MARSRGPISRARPEPTRWRPEGPHNTARRRMPGLSTTSLSPSRRSAVVFDRYAPVNAVFLRRIVSCRLVIGAAIVPDDDVALAPLVAILARRLHHHHAELLDNRVALRLVEALDAQDLAVVVVEERAPGLG